MKTLYIITTTGGLPLRISSKNSQSISFVNFLYFNEYVFLRDKNFSPMENFLHSGIPIPLQTLRIL